MPFANFLHQDINGSASPGPGALDLEYLQLENENLHNIRSALMKERDDLYEMCVEKFNNGIKSPDKHSGYASIFNDTVGEVSNYNEPYTGNWYH